MEGISDQRRSQHKAHLAARHAGLEFVDHLLRDDVTLLNLDLVNRTAGYQQGKTDWQEQVTHCFGNRSRADLNWGDDNPKAFPGIPCKFIFYDPVNTTYAKC